MRTSSNGMIALLLCLLAACASDGGEANDSPERSAGYNDGCASASSRSGSATPDRVFRDKDLYESSEDYRKGWAAGYRNCRSASGEPLSRDRDDPFGGR